MVVLDHDRIDVPLIDNLILGKQLPKFVPNNDEFEFTEENKSSPAKSGQGDEDLRVYDESQSLASLASSSLKTDPSMRDYDYMIEPDEMFSFYKPLDGQKMDEGMGAGLSFMGSSGGRLNQFKGVYELDKSSEDPENRISDLSPSIEDKMDSGEMSQGGPATNPASIDDGVEKPGIRKTLRKGVASKWKIWCLELWTI